MSCHVISCHSFIFIHSTVSYLLCFPSKTQAKPTEPAANKTVLSFSKILKTTTLDLCLACCSLGPQTCHTTAPSSKVMATVWNRVMSEADELHQFLPAPGR